MRTNVIEVDFESWTVLSDVPERYVVSLLEDYHEAVRQGGVAFPEIDASFRELAKAVRL